MKQIEFHPMLRDVPMMPLHERDALATHIEEHGQILPIIIWQGKIIDGRNRYLACLSRGLKPNVINLDKPNAKDYVAGLNYFRKHWTTAERAHYAALMSLESERGRPAESEENGSNAPITQTEAAKRMGVSRESVKRAKAKIKGTDRKTAPQGSKQQGVDEVVRDDAGTPIPKTALPYWNRRPEAKNVLNQISACRGQVKKLEPTDPMWSSVNLNGVLADLNSAYNRFAAAIPAYVCPYCKGVKVDNCKCCKGKGVISKFVMSTVPEEIRNGRA